MYILNENNSGLCVYDGCQAGRVAQLDVVLRMDMRRKNEPLLQGNFSRRVAQM